MKNIDKSLYSILNTNNSYLYLSLPNFSKNIEVSQNILNKIKINKHEILNIIDNWNNEMNMNSFIFIEFLSYKSIIFHLKNMIHYNQKDGVSIEILKKIKNKEEYVDLKMVNEWETILNFQNVIDNSFIFQYLDLYINKFDDDEAEKIIDKLSEIFIKLNFFKISNNKNKKIRNKWLNKLFNYDNICQSFGFKKIIEFLYEYKNKNLSNEEKKDYKKYVNIICNQIIKTEADRKNVILFEQNIKNLFIGIFKFSKIERDDYNQIISKLESFEKIFEEEIINNEFNKEIKFDLKKIWEICNQINLNNNFSEFVGNVIGLTHNYLNKRLNFNLMITSNLKKEESLVETFMDAEFDDYKSWYRPSKESIISLNIKIFSNILQNFILLIDEFSNWFFNHIKNIFIKLSSKLNIHQNDLSNLLNGTKLLCSNIDLLKLGFHKQIEYNLTIIFINLIECICRIISNDSESNLNSLLSKIKKNKKINDNLIEIIRFFLLTIYVQENNTSYGFDIRNRIMHGFFDPKYCNPYEVGFLFITLVNEIHLINDEECNKLLDKEITND